MTINVHLRQMSAVNLAEFKRNMGRYLRKVRDGGEIILSDRDRPLAKVIPLHAGEVPLEIIAPRLGFSGIENVGVLKRSPRKLKTDVTALLSDDRKSR